MTRDPRVDPRPGDELRRSWEMRPLPTIPPIEQVPKRQSLTVRVIGFQARPGFQPIVYIEPMDGWVLSTTPTLELWRSWADSPEVEVIHVAD